MAHRFVQLVLVRHGETEWSRLGRHTGRTDLGLTDEGRAQARFLAPVLARWRFAKVLTSPLVRATETCRLAGLGDRAEVRDDLAEWHYGEYEGLVHDEIKARHRGWDLWRDGCPGGESPKHVASRVDRVIAEVRQLAHVSGSSGTADIQASSASGPAGIVVAFAHGHILRALATRWVDLELRHGAIFDLDTATVSTLGTDHDRPVVVTWNDGHHLG